MSHPRVKVVSVELSRPIEPIEGLEGYQAAQALVRLHGQPLGYVQLPLVDGACSASTLILKAVNQHLPAILRHLLLDLLAVGVGPAGIQVEALLDTPHAAWNGPLPRITVAVCTRDRPGNLARCLGALLRLEYPRLDLLVVDNAPSSEAVEQLVRASYPDVRCVREPRPGLDWARNRAIQEAHGEIIAYTDDDAVVDPGWAQALGSLFAEHPEIMAVTGLVAPAELETPAQLLFEEYGGFGRGFVRKWCRAPERRADRWWAWSTGQYGTGANMAFRRELFDQIGGFDPALDVGTVTNGGGDLEMFFRLLKEGHLLVYEPGALVWHRHRREYAELRQQLTNNGTGFFAYLVRAARAYPDEAAELARLAFWWLRHRMLRRLRRSLPRPGGFPPELILTELYGAAISLGRYRQARRRAEAIARASGTSLPNRPGPTASPPIARSDPGERVAARTVSVEQPVGALTDLAGYARAQIRVTRDGRALGRAELAVQDGRISATRLREAIADQMQLSLLDSPQELKEQLLWACSAGGQRRPRGAAGRAAASRPVLRSEREHGPQQR